MNIVVIADAWEPLTGGGQKLFLELVTRLAKDHLHTITVITRSLIDHQGKAYSANQTLLDGKLKIIRLGPPFKWQNLFARLWFTVQSSIYALKAKPDIYLASTFLPAFSLKLIKLFRKTPQALVVIGFGAESKLYQWLEKLITQKLKYDLVITDDFEFYKNQSNKHNFKLILNGVDLPPSSKTLPKWSNFTFLFVGRNEPRKGVSYLKIAFTKVKRKHPNIKLKIIGPGFKTVSKPQLTKEFLKAHCFILPSLKEGHPLVLFEAWAHKLPVIVTSTGSLPQFVNSSNGYLVPPGDSDRLANVMLKAIENKQLKNLGRNGFNLVKTKHSWEKTVNEYNQALTFLLQ